MYWNHRVTTTLNKPVITHMCKNKKKNKKKKTVQVAQGWLLHCALHPLQLAPMLFFHPPTCADTELTLGQPALCGGIFKWILESHAQGSCDSKIHIHLSLMVYWSDILKWFGFNCRQDTSTTCNLHHGIHLPCCPVSEQKLHWRRQTHYYASISLLPQWRGEVRPTCMFHNTAAEENISFEH